MNRPERNERPTHPDAKYQGKRVDLTQEIQGGFTLKLTLQVDTRDPSQWGTHSVTLWVLPIISGTSVESLKAVAQLSYQLKGPLADLLFDAVSQIDHDIARPY